MAKWLKNQLLGAVDAQAYKYTPLEFCNFEMTIFQTTKDKIFEILLFIGLSFSSQHRQY